MNTSIALLAASVLAGLSISAQAAQASNSIETITIAGSHSPIVVGQIAGALTVIDETRIKASGAIGITDLLRTVAGVNIGQTGTSGSLSEIRFRGSESNHVLVLVDGIQINDGGQGGITDFSHLLLANIARIEILRGPQSAVWGSSAIAGVISITTKQASSENIQGTINLALGDRNTQSLSANVSQQVDKLSYTLNASSYKTDGENISREGDEADGYRNNDLSGGINYRFSSSSRSDVRAR
jgi:vitamin B12 transporter